MFLEQLYVSPLVEFQMIILRVLKEIRKGKLFLKCQKCLCPAKKICSTNQKRQHNDENRQVYLMVWTKYVSNTFQSDLDAVGLFR